jgi:hypothetical protein
MPPQTHGFYAQLLLGAGPLLSNDSMVRAKSNIGPDGSGYEYDLVQ